MVNVQCQALNVQWSMSNGQTYRSTIGCNKLFLNRILFHPEQSEGKTYRYTLKFQLSMPQNLNLKS
jgi:hypothetical protein